MNRSIGSLACVAALLVGCASAPAPEPLPVAMPLVTSSGLVIGTLSYRYVQAGEAPAWKVHLERIDQPTHQDYELTVDVDPDSRSGVFTGALPAGVYSFREAATEGGRFAPGALGMPFEVQAGEVRDAGHYTLNPVLSRR